MIDNCSDYNEDLKSYEGLQLWMRGIIPLLIAVTGWALNIGAIYILYPKDCLQSIFKPLLINLLVWDSILLMFQIVISCVLYIGCVQEESVSHMYSNLLLPFWDIAFFQTILTTVALTFDRYVCYCHRTKYESLVQDHCQSKLIIYLKFMLPMTVFSILFHMPSFFAVDSLVINDLTAPGCHITAKKNYEIAIIHGAFARLFVEGIIPLIMIITCNWKIYKKVTNHISETFFDQPKELKERLSAFKRLKTKIKRTGMIEDDESETLKNTAHGLRVDKTTSKRLLQIEKDLAFAMIGMVSIFVLCQIPYVVFRFRESIFLSKKASNEEFKVCLRDGREIYPLEVLVLKLVAYLFIIINASTNAVFYCFLDTRFKNDVLRYISKFCRRQRSEMASNVALTSLKH